MLVYQRVVALSKTSRLRDFLCIPSGDPLLGWKRRENKATKCKDPILYLHDCTNRCGSGFVRWLFEGKILEIETWYTLRVQRLCIFFLSVWRRTSFFAGCKYQILACVSDYVCFFVAATWQACTWEDWLRSSGLQSDFTRSIQHSLLSHVLLSTGIGWTSYTNLDNIFFDVTSLASSCGAQSTLPDLPIIDLEHVICRVLNQDRWTQRYVSPI